MLKRVTTIVAACCLAWVPLTVLASAQAAVPSASVPVACADSVSSLTVFVDDVVSFGSVPAGCTVVSNSSTGNLDRVSASGFVAFAVGSGAVFQLMTDGTTQYLVKVDVTIVERPAPSPTLTPSPEGSATPSAIATATASPSATLSPSATPVPFVTADATAPQASQRLRPKDVTVGPALEPGTVAFFNDKGHPLQLLSVSGDRDGVRILNRGMDYSSTPANWQRLGYGDLCWTYAGYRGVQGLVLPVATPPFATVPADWVLTAAIATTSSGNRIVLDPVPGQVVTADGRDVNAVTLCADGYAPTPVGPAERSGTKAPVIAPGRGNIGGNVGTGQCRGNGNFKHGCEPTYPNVDTGVVYPVLTPVTGPTGSTGTPTTAPSPRPTPASTAPAEADPLLPICRATGDPKNPYRVETLRVSEIKEGDGNRLFPTPGWTDVIPPNRLLPDGQNWPSGAGMLTTAGAKCQVAQPVVEPQPSASPTPTTTVTALPQPTFTALGPVPTVTPVPQPVFTAYGTITPWPPLYPIPVPGSVLVPTATPTPEATTASPTASPALPTTEATATPDATPGPATPSPFPIPASPTPIAATPTPTASLATPTRAPDTPTLIPPLREPAVPLTPVIAVREPDATVASPTASPAATSRPTPTSTPAPTATPTTQGTASPTATPAVPTTAATSTAVPTAVPDPQTSPASPVATPASPSAASSTPVPTATPSPLATLASPTASPTIPAPTATPLPSASGPAPDGARTVSVLLTNGPDTVTYTTTVDVLLQAVTEPTGTGTETTANTNGPTGGTGGKPGTGPTELANTGATEGWLIVGGIVLAGGSLLLLPAARGRRMRLTVVAGLTVTGLVASTSAAWSVASAERAFGIAQARAATQWGQSPDALARLTFVRPGGEAPLGLDPVYVFNGIDEGTLTRGPGWYPTTSAPGDAGTTAIAGHRTGYGSPFADLDELQRGDTIVMQTPDGGRRTYRVAEVRLVDTDDVWVLGPNPLGTGTSTLTLTTCDPPGVNTQRLVVIASLVSGSSPA